MKKIRIFIVGIVAFLGLYAGLSSHADFSGFANQLLSMDIPINKILSQTGINRYELSRLLNAVECRDCTVPGDEYISRYTPTFWQNFTSQPGRDFDDILYGQALYNKTSYYYCVAYVGDKTYMRGYPETSPVCPGKFCGTRTTTKAEFLQVVMNLLAKYIYPVYSANWTSIDKRVDKLYFWEYAKRTFDENDINLIKKRAKECGNQLCNLQNATELNTYLKYCMFNLKECNMIPFDKIKEGYRPVAELNVLYSQQLISLDNAIKYKIGDLVDGGLAIEILGKINDTIGCSFSNDYDCDGLDNIADTCANGYNPQQKDTDQDGIGDVCDDDIDNDGIKNPIGIVDDNGNINIRLWNPSIDNCLFVVNKNQADANKSLIGDACKQSSNRLSLTIGVEEMQGTLPKTVRLNAVSKGAASEFKRDFGDGSVGYGTSISHVYANPGTYIVRLSAKGNTSNDAHATTTLIIGRDQNEKQGLSLLNTALIIKEGGEGSFSLSSLGIHDSYQRTIDKTVISTKQASLKKKFIKSGTYPISVKALRNGKIVAATLFSLSVGDFAYGSILSVSSILPEKYQEVLFDTKISNFSSSFISRIVWDFGDGKQLETKQSTLKYSYQSAGRKVILQTIYLNDGTKLQNMITLFVNAENIFSSYALQLLPTTLDLVSFQSLAFKTSLIGSPFSTIIFANTLAGDATNTIFPIRDRIVMPLQANHTYKNPGIYYPQTQISLDQCYQLSAQATLAVGGHDFCLQSKIDNTLSKYVCDMDKDTIPDICDDDIDGDGVQNLIGMINPASPSNCNYLGSLSNTTSSTTSSSALVNMDILKTHFTYTCILDNAPFNANDSQVDQNKNGIGDSMEDTFNSTLLTALTPISDVDVDGILDKDDLCPTIPELWNDISDYDGCPELGIESYCDNNSYTKGPTPIDLGEPAIPPGLVVYCGNEKWDLGETCQNCPDDIQNCGTQCGNGTIDAGETCLICPEDAGSCSIICGNGKIEVGETCQNCPEDAGSCLLLCGNSKRDFGETCKTCPQDISYCGTLCGNGKIDANETCQNCPEDAGICSNTCGNKRIDVGETCQNCPTDLGVCPVSCGNGKIDANENCNNCPKDLGSCNIVCGNKIAEIGETCKTCPQDISNCSTTCGNGKIDANETCQNCPEDAGICSNTCGNKRIDAGETCKNCPADVGVCPPFCNNGKFDPGETCQNCPTDLGSCSIICGNKVADLGETCQNCPEDITNCPPLCGNGKIETGETCQNCPKDVGYCTIVCGNGIVDPGETCKTCPQDISYCLPSCGNGKIELGENCQNCPEDAGSCSIICGNGIADLGETCFNCPKDVKNCSTSCGDGKIDANENCSNCPKDVGYCSIICGNGIADPGETCFSCPKDVPNCSTSCGNGKIDANENCQNCPKDVGYCSIICGNGIAEIGETCFNCAKDIPSCPTTCGNGKIDASENCSNCPKDIGSCSVICGNGTADPGETCFSCPKDIPSCPTTCGNDKIDPNENCNNCPKDIGSCTAICGNGVADPGETCFSCAKDIPNCSITCGDGKIDANENCNNCPKDIGSCSIVCGNGVAEIGETCFNCPKDVKNCSTSCGDGKIDANENCSNCLKDVGSCTAICGNGVADPGETCQNCLKDVKNCLGSCGNKIVEANLGEQCDHGNNNGKDFICSSTCTLIKTTTQPKTCGNGKIDIGEVCSNCSEDLRDLCVTQCGNGLKELIEQCDNGINNGKDGRCSVMCTTIDPSKPLTCGNGLWNLGETCQNCPDDLSDICITQCGNGVKELAEQCDHGISNGKDSGCSITCTTIGPNKPLTCGNGLWNLGETCQNCPDDLPDLCVTQCGNGVKELTEQCDNGTNNGKDGKCSVTCRTSDPTKPLTCGNGLWNLGETCLTCPDDLPDICVTQCGNGIKELTEQCDNGINNGKDGKCSVTCSTIDPTKPLTCGNGLWNLGETCQNCPIDLSDICVTQCGNGIKELTEQCDNGTNNGKDGKCSVTCRIIDPSKPLTCGNGLWNLGETCQNCPEDLSEICTTQCGNGVRELTEQCDNGANNGKDGKCSLLCKLIDPNKPITCGNLTIDLGESCLNCPEDLSDICITQCGNGVRELTEQCDNGTNNGKDGKCSLLCKLVDPNKPITCGNTTIDLGENCINCPEDLTDLLCATLCGNGIKEATEQCDNGANNGKDGRCSSFCTPIDPTKPITCGNGKFDPGETCLTCPIDLPDPGVCITRCGNKLIDTLYGEECDNGPTNGIDGLCSITCKNTDPNKPLTCGNGNVESGETCANCPQDLPNPNICITRCGNKTIEPDLGEQCDNGPTNGTDGICSKFCISITIITGPDPTIVCGNGKIDPGETCVNCPEDVGNCLFIITPPCMQCPCPFADVDSALTTDDMVKAVLRDKTKKYPWKYSLGLKISY